MIPIFNNRGCLLVQLAKESLSNGRAAQTIELLMRDGLQANAGVLLLDTNYQPIESDTENMGDLKLGVILPEGVDTLPMNPIKFYIKRTDKRGAVLRGHPFVTIGELSLLAAQALDLPQSNQEIYFNGRLLDDPTQTLLEIGLEEGKVVHVLDTRLLIDDHAQTFSVELQGAKFPSDSRTMEVTGATNIKDFREWAGEAIGIPASRVVVAYCSQILEGDDWTLAQLKFVPNALIKILDDNDATTQRIMRKQISPLEKHRGVHRTTSQDSFRQLPKFQIRRTDSFEWHDFRAKSIDASEGSGSVLSPCPSPIGRSVPLFYRSTTTGFKSRNERAQPSEPIGDSKSEIVEFTQPDHVLVLASESSAVEPKSEAAQSLSQAPSNQAVASVTEEMNRIDLIPESSNHSEHSAPRLGGNIQEFLLEISDIDSNHYRLRVSEIDTIRDVKLKLQLNNPDMPSDTQDLLLDGRLLEDYEVLQHLFPQPSDEDAPSLFLLRRGS